MRERLWSDLVTAHPANKNSYAIIMHTWRERSDQSRL
jgi:hypothetical protein